MAKIRTFIAVNVSPKIQANAARLIDRLRLTCSDYKWVERENLHITLNFLGDVDEKEIPEVCSRVKKAVTDHPAFDIRLGGLGCFPNAEKPKVVWLGSKTGTEQLAQLHESIADSLKAMRFPRDRNEFHPHLTLGRLRRGGRWNQSLTDALNKLSDFEAGQCLIDQIVVYSSFLDRMGPTHTAMSTILLG